jgi:hypothetical protein
VFKKVVGTSFTEMFAANDWKPFQSCYFYRHHDLHANFEQYILRVDQVMMYCYIKQMTVFGFIFCCYLFVVCKSCKTVHITNNIIVNITYICIGISAG